MGDLDQLKCHLRINVPSGNTCCSELPCDTTGESKKFQSTDSLGEKSLATCRTRTPHFRLIRWLVSDYEPSDLIAAGIQNLQACIICSKIRPYSIMKLTRRCKAVEAWNMFSITPEKALKHISCTYDLILYNS